MKWHCLENQDLLFIDKPEGSETSRTSDVQPGLLELWQEHLGQPLFMAHRLETTTSGAMVFAKTKAAADILGKAFAKREIKKTYWFLTDRTSEFEEYEAESLIEKSGSNTFTSDSKSRTPNAKTEFKRLKRSPFFELWSATPTTGQAHQIRLHARDIGLPILGDTLYGGTEFSRLCLHSVSLHVPGYPEWQCPVPRLFERLGLLKNREICDILSSIDRRHRQFAFLQQPDEVLRLVHFEVEGLEVDLLGPQLWVQWFRENDPTSRELEMWACVGRILNRKVLIQKRWNREKQHGPAPKWMSEDFPALWFANENGVQYEFRRDSGESHGLFLDQRLNRLKLSDQATGLSVLNLFAYTGGFGLAAVKKGAVHASTVDLSAVAIEWARQNFALNHELTDRHEFFTADSFFFMERAQKKGRTWDLIVCDPPIFSRNRDNVFRIEKDAIKLLKLCHSVLAPKGMIFFSTHYEKWTMKSLHALIKQSFPDAKVTAGQVDLDFPKESTELKSFFIRF